jgi:hypothetical protein
MTLEAHMGSFCCDSLIDASTGFEERNKSQLKKYGVDASPVRFGLFIVCPEGAVARDGMEIDSFANVGSTVWKWVRLPRHSTDM